MKRLGNNLCGIFNLDQNTLGKHLFESRNSRRWEQNVDVNKRVSLKCTENDERKMSGDRPSILIECDDGSKKSERICDCKAYKPARMHKVEDKQTLSAAKPSFPSPNTIMFKKRGQKRSGNLKVKPPALRRSLVQVKLPEEEEPREKANVPFAEIEFDSSSESEKNFSDRSPVFGGWPSESLSHKSNAMFRLSYLLSSDTEFSYGGEEGAKAPGQMSSNRSILKANSFSEGRSEYANIRPEWNSETEDLPEVLFCFKSGASPVSSSAHSFRIMESSYDGRNKSIHLAAPNKMDGGTPVETSPSKEYFVGENEGRN